MFFCYTQNPVLPVYPVQWHQCECRVAASRFIFLRWIKTETKSSQENVRQAVSFAFFFDHASASSFGGLSVGVTPGQKSSFFSCLRPSPSLLRPLPVFIRQRALMYVLQKPQSRRPTNAMRRAAQGVTRRPACRCTSALCQISAEPPKPPEPTFAEAPL